MSLEEHEESSFHFFTREFDFSYILADFILVSAYLCWLWHQGKRMAILRGAVMGCVIYYIDGHSWFNTRLEPENKDSRFQRTWLFTINDVTYERAEDGSHNYLNLSDTFVLLKHAADWMMTVSYGLFWFTWETVVFYQYMQLNGRVTTSTNTFQKEPSLVHHSLLVFGLNFLVYPLSLVLPLGHGIHAVGSRAMHNAAVFWRRYMYFWNAVYVLYATCVRGRSVKTTLRDVWFTFCVGCFQALGMVAPLYLFRIRPDFEWSKFLYEIVFLMNAGSTEHFLHVDIILVFWQRRESCAWSIQKRKRE